MVSGVLVYLVAGVVVVVAFGRVYAAYVEKNRLKGAVDWPEAEATIRSGNVRLVGRGGHRTQKLPFFAFSYEVDGEYYSGRFGLQVDEERAGQLSRDLVDTKITVRYDPKRPETYCLPEELPVEGYRVSVVPD
jgi:hypothetical protein